MLTLIVAKKSETPCEPELLLFTGMKDHLHAAGLLEPLRTESLQRRRSERLFRRCLRQLMSCRNWWHPGWDRRREWCSRHQWCSRRYASMPPALQFVYAMLVLIAEGNGWWMLMAAPNRELEPVNLRPLRSEVAAAWADVSHVLRSFYELADILTVLEEVRCLEVSNLARQPKFNPEVGDDHPMINHLTASLWLRSMEPTITSSTSNLRGPQNKRKNVAAAEKKVESMLYRLTQEREKWPILTPRI